MKDRIIQFLTEKSLSAAKFADMIGVQRSSISHLLSGRNKPSFDFIEKMLMAFPDIDAQWLIIGKKSVQSENAGKITEPDLFNQKNNITPPESVIQNSDYSKSIINNPQIENISIKTNEKEHGSIERIVIFYTNKTFVEYQP